MPYDGPGLSASDIYDVQDIANTKNISIDTIVYSFNTEHDCWEAWSYNLEEPTASLYSVVPIACRASNSAIWVIKE